MSTRRSIEKEEFWRLAIAEQQASGTTIKSFCAQQGLAVHAFSWWKRQIKKRDLRRDKTQLVPVTVIADANKSREPFDTTCADQSIIEVVSPTGYLLRINAEAPSHHLTGLLDAVTSCNAIGGKPC